MLFCGQNSTIPNIEITEVCVYDLLTWLDPIQPTKDEISKYSGDIGWYYRYIPKGDLIGPFVTCTRALSAARERNQ